MLGGKLLALQAGLVAALIAGCTPGPTSSPRPSPSETRTVTGVLPPAPTPRPADASPAPTLAIYPRLAIPPRTSRCHTSQVEVAFNGGNGAAGSVEDFFELRNKSQQGCWVYGFVGFQMLDGSHRPVGPPAAWITDSYFGKSDPPTRIFLPAATTALGVEPRTGHAFFNIFTSDALCDSNQNPVDSLEIWPPDEYQPLTIPAQTAYARFSACGSLQLNPLQIQPQPSLG